MKRTFVVLLCATLSLAMGVTSSIAGSNPKGKPFVAINGQIVEVVNAAVLSIDEKIENLTGRVDSLEGRIEASEVAIADLEERNAALEVLVANNVSDIGQIDLLISDLQHGKCHY